MYIMYVEYALNQTYLHVCMHTVHTNSTPHYILTHHTYTDVTQVILTPHIEHIYIHIKGKECSICAASGCITQHVLHW